MEWLASGTRRDVCILLYGRELGAQTLKSELEARYDRRVKPDRFYGAVEAQFEWMHDRLGTDVG